MTTAANQFAASTKEARIDVGKYFSTATAPALTAIVGDVSGKGLPAAMRVAMILGALRARLRTIPEKFSGLSATR